MPVLNNEQYTEAKKEAEARYDILARLDVLEKENSQLKIRLQHSGSKLPGIEPTSSNIVAMFFIEPNQAQGGYCINAAATLELHHWDLVAIVKGHWKQGSVQWRVRASILGKAGQLSPKGSIFTVREWLDARDRNELTAEGTGGSGH